MRRKRCTLCGGKLVNGICQECGLDNRKSEFDTTHATNIIKLLGTLPDEKEILLEKIKNSTMKKLKDDKK